MRATKWSSSEPKTYCLFQKMVNSFVRPVLYFTKALLIRTNSFPFPFPVQFQFIDWRNATKRLQQHDNRCCDKDCDKTQTESSKAGAHRHLTYRTAREGEVKERESRIFERVMEIETQAERCTRIHQKGTGTQLQRK